LLFLWESKMPHKKSNPEYNPPFPVSSYRFDQKNEVFKRARWDERIIPYLKHLEEKRYGIREGYRHIDYALQEASWNLERRFGFGNWRSNSGLYSWEINSINKANQEKAEKKTYDGSPEELSRLIKKAALFCGADLVGICQVHPNWVYSHEFNVITMEHKPLELPEGCENVIALAVEMDYVTMHTAPTAIAGAATGLGYSRMAFVANMLATFIRSLGYRAVPCGNDTALSIPIAMAAGLGEWSRMGLLITEKFGPRVRLCKVFTDMPLKHDSFRPIGAVEFCRTCKTCAELCPSRAIPEGNMTEVGPNISSHSGILKWYIDGERCYSFWAKNNISCSICLRVCPFNQRPGKIHDAARFLIRNTTLFNKLLVHLHTILKYGKPFPADRFWNI
jgi:epoxyqueuosine reductase